MTGYFEKLLSLDIPIDTRNSSGENHPSSI